MNNIVMSAVELIYCYAECLALHGKDSGVHSVAPAVELLKKLLFFRPVKLFRLLAVWPYLRDCFMSLFQNRHC